MKSAQSLFLNLVQNGVKTHIPAFKGPGGQVVTECIRSNFCTYVHSLFLMNAKPPPPLTPTPRGDMIRFGGQPQGGFKLKVSVWKYLFAARGFYQGIWTILRHFEKKCHVFLTRFPPLSSVHRVIFGTCWPQFFPPGGNTSHRRVFYALGVCIKFDPDTSVLPTLLSCTLQIMEIAICSFKVSLNKNTKVVWTRAKDISDPFWMNWCHVSVLTSFH